MGFFSNIKDKITGHKDSNNYLNGFSKSRKALKSKLKIILDNNQNYDGNFFEQIMVTLIEADLGYKTSEKICSLFKEKINKIKTLSKDEVINLLVETIYDNYKKDEEKGIVYSSNGTTVILLIGVNGSGKTSTAAKLANMYKSQNKKVCLAAGDTFRAGAVDQLKKFANDLGVDFIEGKEKEDPSSVFVNACRFAKENNIDFLICDTAGRLQNKTNLMKELEKINRVIGKEIEGGPHNTWLVIDSNTGQNGISQASIFNEVTNISGIILTKTDGTSKGGIVIAIKDILNIPVRYITFGEKIEDINEFDLNLYLYSLIGDLNEDI